MRDINEINESGGVIDLMPAEDLRKMTITKEEMFQRDKENILQSLMSSMVSNANTNGVYEYSANLNPRFDEKLLDEIVEEFKTLGYKVEVTESESKDYGKYKTIHISWELQ